MPVLPAFGGKLNSTIATLRSLRSLRRSATRRAVREASISARSAQTYMSPPFSVRSNLQNLSQPGQATSPPSERPP